VQVRDAMAKTFSAAKPDDGIVQVARLMKQEDAGFIPIVSDGRLVGVVTDRDIVIRCLAEDHDDVLAETAGHVMSTAGLHTVAPDADIEAAATIMDREEVRRLAVVEDGRLVGVLSHGNLVQALRGEGGAKRATIGVTRGA
jgi:CBS domain-containing protein